jgi:hypothetical protein
MNEDFESRLRAALRPVDPSDEFSQGLIARVTAVQDPAARGRAARRLFAPAGWASAALAASLLLAVGVQHHLQQQREREQGMEARRQVIEALRMTSQKLHLAYEAIENQSS